MIRSTIELYVSAIKETVEALLRGPFVWLFLIVLPAVLGGLGLLVSPFGIVGGFVLGFASVALFGAYLYGVAQSIEARKPLGLGIVRESLGHHLWDVMGIAFLHWIVSMAFSFGNLPSAVTMVLGIVGFVLFNPWMEVIHSDRVQGSMDILARAFRFMSANGPEWIIPHLLIFALLGGFTLVPGSIGSFLAFGSGVALHPIMVFRGVLYRKLSSGSRRSRAWRSRF